MLDVDAVHIIHLWIVFFWGEYWQSCKVVVDCFWCEIVGRDFFLTEVWDAHLTLFGGLNSTKTIACAVSWTFALECFSHYGIRRLSLLYAIRFLVNFGVNFVLLQNLFLLVGVRRLKIVKTANWLGCHSVLDFVFRFFSKGMIVLLVLFQFASYKGVSKVILITNQTFNEPLPRNFFPSISRSHFDGSNRKKIFITFLFLFLFRVQLRFMLQLLYFS